jgi:dTDP-4-amino-4,6-dideoxygalactose transaminase
VPKVTQVGTVKSAGIMSEGLIPFNRPTLVGTEQAYMAAAIDGGRLSGDGAYTKRCSDFLQRTLGVSKALITTSCTHALEMSALLLNIEPGDEVIIPSFTFVSTANAFALRGARIVFADIRRDTLNVDEKVLESLITPRTKAIVVVHYAGVACEMDAIVALARKHGISVVEDNAHGLFATYKGRYLGTFGEFATQSFHDTKNITCGEGGALLINDPAYVEEAEIVREKGTNRARFFRGQIDKYTWVALGSSYLPSEILAAFLLAQLEDAETIQNKRRMIWERYNETLQVWAKRLGIGLPNIPEYCGQSFHMYYLIMPDLATRQGLISHLKEAGISAVFHYLPLHLSEMGLRLGGRPGDCPVTEDLSDRLLRLPFFTDLAEADQMRVIERASSFTPREATYGVT